MKLDFLHFLLNDNLSWSYSLVIHLYFLNGDYYFEIDFFCEIPFNIFKLGFLNMVILEVKFIKF